MSKYRLLKELIELFPCPPFGDIEIKYRVDDDEYFVLIYNRIILSPGGHKHVREWINRLCLFINIPAIAIMVSYE